MPSVADTIRRPRIVLVTGAPGSGKTTLATEIGRALQIPFIGRDDVRRALYLTAGGWSDEPGPVPTRGESVDTFLRLVEATTSLGVSLVAEYVVSRDRPQEFTRLSGVAECRVIRTRARRALERFETRHRQDRLLNRRPVLDALGFASVEEHTVDAVSRMRSVADAMMTDFEVPTLVVDTDDGYDPGFEDILGFVTADRPTG